MRGIKPMISSNRHQFATKSCLSEKINLIRNDLEIIDLTVDRSQITKEHLK